MPSSTCQYQVENEQSDATLAAAIRQWQPETSWRQARNLVATRRVLINGTLCLDDARRLHPGDLVLICEQSRAAPPQGKDLRVCHHDSHIAVVDKPPGILTERHHAERKWPARRKARQPTLDELLSERLEALSSKNRPTLLDQPSPIVHAVHRLDRETSGLLVFALTEEARNHLIDQFRQHTVQREYIAVVRGDVDQQTITSHFVRDRGDGLRGSSSEPGRGKRAITHVTPLESVAGFTVVSCRLETGRTHQIRIHLAEAGHPLCGEKRYGDLANRQPTTEHSFPRHALHAAKLGFTHPLTCQKMEFESPLPRDLQRLIERLRKA